MAIMSSAASARSADQALPHKPAVQPVENIDSDDDTERNYQIKSFKFWSIMIGMYAAIFLVALDRMIIAVAIPAMTNDFNSIEDIGWYGSAYMLTCASFFPIFGRIYQIYSLKWTYLISIVIFEVGSAVCGAAPTSVAFILGRAIAGLGSAGIFSGGMLVIIAHVPLRKRPMFTAFFGMAFGVSSVIGPLIGGSLTDRVSWRWCFYINLPIGAVTIMAMLFFLHVPSPKREKLSMIAQVHRLDPIGCALFLPSMVSLILALQWGGTTYAWSAPTMIGLLVTFAVLFVLFVAFEALTPDTAMIPTRVLNRSMYGAMVFTFIMYGAIMSIIYYLVIWFQAVKNDSAMDSGLSTIPMVLAMVLSSVATAKFTESVGYYVPAMLLSPALVSAGTGLLSTFTPGSPRSHWIGYQVLIGSGLGCGAQQSTLVAQNMLPRHDVPVGMGLLFLMQQLGGSVLLSVSQNVFSSRLVGRLSGVAGLDAQSIVHTGSTEIRNVVLPGELGAVVEAYNYAVTRVFLMAAVMSAVMILPAAMVKWKSIKGEKKGGDGSSTSAEKNGDVEV